MRKIVLGIVFLMFLYLNCVVVSAGYYGEVSKSYTREYETVRYTEFNKGDKWGYVLKREWSSPTYSYVYYDKPYYDSYNGQGVSWNVYTYEQQEYHQSYYRTYSYRSDYSSYRPYTYRDYIPNRW